MWFRVQGASIHINQKVSRLCFSLIVRRNEWINDGYHSPSKMPKYNLYPNKSLYEQTQQVKLISSLADNITYGK